MEQRAFNCLLLHSRKGWMALYEAHCKEYLEQAYWASIATEDPPLADLASEIFNTAWMAVEGKDHFGWVYVWHLAKWRWVVLKSFLREWRKSC